MSSSYGNTSTGKSVSSKDGNAVDKQTISRGLNPAAAEFIPKSTKMGNKDKEKTTSGLDLSGKDTDVEDEFPGITETHAIPVWVSNDSGQELSNSQQRRRRRWRKAAREAEAKKVDKEKEKLRQEYLAMNELDAKPSDDAARRQRYKKKGEGFLNNV